MPRQLPPLAAKFEADAVSILNFVLDYEVARAASPRVSADRLFTLSRVHFVYEVSFLKIFVCWENFLEDSFLRYLCGYSNNNGTEVLIQPRFRTITAANAAVLGGSDFVSWADPDKVLRRAQRFITRGLHESVISSDLSRLRGVKDMRNHVAHASTFSALQFAAAVTNLGGTSGQSQSVGAFLRSNTNPYAVVGKRWLADITDGLIGLSYQIAP